jgi:hypothetical protein
MREPADRAWTLGHLLDGFQNNLAHEWRAVRAKHHAFAIEVILRDGSAAERDPTPDHSPLRKQ